MMVKEAMQPTETTSGQNHGLVPELPVWEWLDRLRATGRGGVPLVEVVAPLAGLLVLRWAAFMEAEQEAVAAFDDTPFSPLLPDSLRQETWQSPGELPARLRAGLDALGPRQDAATIKYTNSVAPLVRRSAEHDPDLFRELVMWVAGLSFDTSERRNAAAMAFDDLLTHVVEAQGKYGGEFTTPQPIIDLMVELVDPKPGDRIYDPCFGVGGLLVGAARRLRMAVAIEGSRPWDEVRSQGIFGIEINAASFAIGLCRLILAGIDHPGLELGDALERPLPRNRAAEGFDCILASPPWGGRVADHKARQYPVPTGGVENLFLQHVMANLRPQGRAVIALPEGTLFRTGADRQVRKTLLSEFRVDGVISLPEGAFAPFANILSSLVVFRRDTPRSSVRFVRISAIGPALATELSVSSSRSTPNAHLVSEPRSGYTVRPVSQAAPLEMRPGLRKLFNLIRDQQDPFGKLVDEGEAWEVSIQTLAARDYELIAKRTGAKELETILERLRATDPVLQVVALEHLADVFQGVSYEQKLTTACRNDEKLVPLIRVGDIIDPHVKPPTLYFTIEATNRVREEQHLRLDDLLITISGTVGKIGVVGDSQEIQGALATKSLVVIRPHEGIMPAFLAALLRSPAYQEWLTGHARGTTIRHLSVRTLRKLALPLPPVPVQDAVLRNLTTGGDALALLVRYVTGSTTDPIAVWLERPAVVSLLSNKVTSSESALTLSEAGHELQGLRPIRNKVAHNTETGMPEPVVRWLLEAVEVGAVLVDIDAVPEGAPRLAVLELAKSRAEGARQALVFDDSPVCNRLRAFMAALVRLIEQAAKAILGPVSITVRPEPTELMVGVPTEVQLHLRNESPTGLRSLSIATHPDVGTGNVDYLAEAASTIVPLTIQVTDAIRPFHLLVRWEAVRLDGTPVHGEVGIELLVRSTRETVLARDLGASPYIVGNPVDREEMFYGRSDVIEQIKRQLSSTTNANVILLEGNRRTGKTSILRQLQKKGALPGWVAIYCSFQDAEGDETRIGISTQNVYRLLARTLGWSLFDAGIRTWFPGESAPTSERPFKVDFREALNRAFSGEHPFETFETYLGTALEAVQPCRVLLMLDEFDKLQEGIDSGITSPQVPENIRHILQHHQGISAILTGSLRLKRLREEYWSALFGLGYRIGISALPLEDARRLVTEPVADRLSYLPQARDRLVELCACQPYFVQSLCARVFEKAAKSGERIITNVAVNEVAAEMVQNNEHFQTLWGYVQTHRRRLLLALCQRLADGPDAVNLELLFIQLESFGVHVPRKSALGDDLAYLRELELIEFDQSYRGGSYRIAVPLLGMWIQASIDFDDSVARAREEAQT